jgi:acyl carrier protein
VNTQQAHDLVTRALREVAPDLNGVDGKARLREDLDLDSLDFLSFVEQLGERSGIRIEEDDYPALTTVDSAADYLTARTGQGR